MPRRVAAFPKSPSPFLLERNEHVVYDCAEFAGLLGHDFVQAACEEVRRQKFVSGVKHSTWCDNYATNLELLLEGLVAFSRESASGHPTGSFTEDQWHSFGSWMAQRVYNRPLADRTKSKLVLTLNKLLTILSAASVIPLRIELPRQSPRKIARAGESKFTKRGWGRKAPDEKILSLFAVQIEAHGRAYDYEPYHQLGRHFLLQVVPNLALFYANCSAGTAKKTHNTMVDFFRFLCSEREHGRFPDLFSQLESEGFSAIESLSWEQALYAWRDHQFYGVDGPKTGSLLKTAHQTVKKLGQVWRSLADASLVPDVALVGFKNAKKRAAGSRTRQTLAQLSPIRPLSTAGEDEVIGHLGQIFEPADKREAHEFIRSLCYELSPDEVRGLSCAELVDAIHALNSKRLKELRACAEMDFLKWYAHWERGQAALAAATIPAETLVELLDSPIRSVSERKRSSTELLFDGPESLRLGNALRYVIAKQDGIATGIHGRYHHLMRSFGGRFDFHAYLHPHHEATLALWVLLLVDSGANCEVVREMPFKCVQGTNDPKVRKVVFAGKNRSGGKAVVDELPSAPAPGQKISAIDAIECYQRMSARYRGLADKESKTCLFLHEYMASVHALQEWTARSWFVAFTRRYAVLDGLGIRPSFIRPSVLLEVQHRNADDVVSAQAVADHMNLSTTLRHYTGGTPTKLQFALKIREFQDRFQAVIIVSINGATEKLGLSEEQFQRIFSDAARTGLGVACLNPQAGVQPGTKPGNDCTRLDACHGCEMRWVVGTVNNIADLILFNEHLKASQADAHRQQPDAWEQRWLPWLVFSDIALAKLAQGETASAFFEAQQVAALRRTAYQPFPLL